MFFYCRIDWVLLFSVSVFSPSYCVPYVQSGDRRRVASDLSLDGRRSSCQSCWGFSESRLGVSEGVEERDDEGWVEEDDDGDDDD